MYRIYVLRELANGWELRRHGRSRSNYISASAETALQRFDALKGCRPAIVQVVDRQGATVAEHRFESSGMKPRTPGTAPDRDPVV